MAMQRLNRLCLVRPADLDEIDGGKIRRKQEEDEESHHRRRLLRLRRRLAGLLRRLRKWRSFGFSCRHPEATHSQQFKDTDGVLLNYNSKAFRYNPRIFTFSELFVGSNGFCEKQLLGSGGFGRVYLAVLPSDGTLVAVKCVADSAGEDRIEKTFLAELAAVAQLRHRNLVRLRGWCFHEAQHQLLLVYDYMPNRSLDRILFRSGGKNSPPVLGWERRRNILSGLAAALFYLHEQLDTQIIHRDVKASNVMLDSEFNARLGDFGLARWLEHDLESDFSAAAAAVAPQVGTRSGSHKQFRLTQTSRIGGTIGYLPPESFDRKSATTAKSDVFSFGVVVLEVASGRRAVDLTYPDEQIVLLDWVRRLSDEGKALEAVDSRLPDGSFALSDARMLIHLGLLCSLHEPHSRPSMKWVMQVLSCEFAGDLPALPLFRSLPRYISISSSATSTPIATGVTVTVTTTSSTWYKTADGSSIFITADADEEPTHQPHEPQSSSTAAAAVISVDAPREIPYREILSATDDFSEEKMVAEMDFGTAYHGYLANGLHVLVKRLGMKTCPALRARFTDEFRNLGSLRHRNVVQLRGWCTEQGEMLVVYDYLPHRSLSHLLFHSRTPLRWPHRYSIVKSLASAVLYLHEEWDEQVIHRSITSSAICLDADGNPRLGSFALAEFLTRNANGHHVAHSGGAPRGIFGYMSPEYMESGAATTAADVYSFGVVILEIVSGRRAVDFRWPQALLVQKLHEFEMKGRSAEEVADWRLEGEYEREELQRLVRVGLACTASEPKLRPSMRQIVSALDGKGECLRPLMAAADEGSRRKRREEWEEINASSLSLVKRIQALGIQ